MDKIAFRKPRHISITVPENVYNKLAETSALEGRSVSNLAAYLLENILLLQSITAEKVDKVDRRSQNRRSSEMTKTEFTPTFKQL
ncbi:hypothetical protein KBY75_01780 [Cyanobium sp. T1G-Tous]|uniref:ribbon-helix-helix domain-containing protein n=1 Tax=Cyanobium sp. T1G-Tous TaxID=2823722 RepID=UPI0028F45963|nr:hypothetical protein [Cyanobium sp. T1G-Tous]MCP9802294.1 hypothetical protein [Cyanobium sp. T1G-Tous]